MSNMQGCRDFWKGYRRGRIEIETYGVHTARDRYYFGYCGNGNSNYSRGFISAINKSLAKLSK